MWTKTAADRQRDAQVYGAEWRKARAAQLRRQPDCELRYDGICLSVATEVDHILGAARDPRHRWLRSVCSPCHRRVTARQGGGYRKTKTSQQEPQLRQATLW